jgi:hypothetical protein
MLTMSVKEEENIVCMTCSNEANIEKDMKAAWKRKPIVQVPVTAEMKEKLTRIKQKNGTSYADITRAALNEWLSRQPEPSKQSMQNHIEPISEPEEKHIEAVQEPTKATLAMDLKQRIYSYDDYCSWTEPTERTPAIQLPPDTFYKKEEYARLAADESIASLRKRYER